MKISIDTKEDSHEEIRKIIRMLSSLVGEEVRVNQGNIFEDNTPSVSDEPQSGNVLGNLFGSTDTPASAPSTDVPETTIESNAEEPEKNESPSIEFYD